MTMNARPPIITILGHVDHGKTSLLDYIRKTRVQAREAGGITQHIGAYQIEYNGKPVTFIDTPGHAAFNKMRQRGAQITDIVILVVAANDGVKPQTIESIRFIKQANVPFLVAINKMDIEGVRTDTVKSQLAEHEVIVQDFGGDIEVVEVSAKTGKGVDKLLETITLMAELMELQADTEAPLEAVVIESSKDTQKGSVASVIVQQGTLSVRQDIFIDNIEGRVKLLSNERGESLDRVLPGYPAEIVGLKEVPEVGAIVKEIGREYAEKVVDAQAVARKNPWAAFDVGAAFGEKIQLNLILKADVKGTLEAIEQNIDPESVKLISSGVGPLTEQEVEMASTTKSLVIVFGMKVPRSLKDFAKPLGVKIKEYDVIYHLIEDLQKQMLKILEPTIDEVVTGEAEIMQVFEMKGDRIAGVRVKTGEVKKADLLHLKRGDVIIGNPVIANMKHGKDDIIVIKTKNEGGLTFRNKRLDFEVGDIIIAYKKEDE